MGNYQPGNSYGIATRFKPGKSGNPRGSQRGSASVREYWNVLLAENADGVPRFTLTDLWCITEAPNDDKKVSNAKRIAARQIIEAVKGGRSGFEALSMIFDRTEGRPSQSVLVSGSLVADPAAEITAETLEKIRTAAIDNGANSDV